MPTATVTLSAIPGVTVYSTKAAALSGAVDSAAAINTYLAAQTTSAGSPLVILWDGWIYVTGTQTLKYTPPTSGFITHKPGPSVAGNGAGAVFGTRTNASPMMVNGTTTINPASIVNTDVIFTTNTGGVGLTFDANVSGDSPTQPHDDATYGWSQLFECVGVNRITLNGVTLLNPRTFASRFVNGDGLTITNSTVNVGVHSTPNYDGFHVNGPFTNISMAGNTVLTNDDGFPLNADEPYLDTGVPNYCVGTLAGWTGGDISHAILLNNVLNGARFGVRLLSLTHRLDDILIDGLSGTGVGYFLNADNYDEVPNYLGGQAVNRIGTLTVRNITAQASGAYLNYKPARLYFHATIGTLNLDLTTCTPVSADGASTVPYVQFHPSMPLPATMTLGPTNNLVVGDQWQRANSSTVGNGWTDTDSKFAISSNHLVSTGDGSTHGLLQAGTTNANGYAATILESVLGDQTAVAVLRHTGSGTEYECAFNAGNSGSNASHGIYRIVSGSATLLLQRLNLKTASGDRVTSLGAAAGSFILGGAFNITTNNWTAAFTSVVDTSIASAGSFGLGVNAGSGTVTFDYGGVSTFPAAATLTAITVRNIGTDSYGNALFAATGNGTAYTGGGTWTTSAGTIDAFGRLRGLSSGQSATVTYTKGAVSGNTSYTQPGSGGGGSGTSLSLGGMSLSL